MKQNTIKNDFKGASKKGRFFLGAYHMVEARRSLDLAHSQAKRAGRKLGSYSHWAPSCGCCVLINESKPAHNYRESLFSGIFAYTPESDSPRRKRRKGIAHEVGGVFEKNAWQY